LSQRASLGYRSDSFCLRAICARYQRWRAKSMLIGRPGWHPGGIGEVDSYFFAFFIPRASFTACATPLSAAVCFTFALSAPVSDFRALKYCPCSFRARLTFGVTFFTFFATGLAAVAWVILPSRRCSRYFLILDLATFLWSLQTIPKIGAAGFLQPGTGQSCFGGFFFSADFFTVTSATSATACLRGLPGPRFCGTPKAPASAAWIF